MLEFEEPDDKYDVKESKEKTGKPKVIVLTLFLVLALVILLLAENDYNFDFFHEVMVPVSANCNPIYEFNSQDSETTLAENAEEILSMNMPLFNDLEGFEDGQVKYKSVLQDGKKIPEIVLEFKEVVDTDEEIPEEICGFDVNVVYK